MDKIKVLWMNNGDKNLWAFVENSNLRFFDIVTCRNMKECRNRLSRYNQEDWDAIMLNSEPRLEFESPKSQNLTMAFLQVVKYTDAPIFIVTANENVNEWDKREAIKLSGDKFYELQKSSSQLYEDIKTEVENNEDFQIRKKYEVIYDFYLSIEDSKSDALLMKLLRGLHAKDFYKDPLVPANVRLILDKVMTYLTNIGILQEIKFNGSNLNKCSVELGNKDDIVPYHIQRCFHSCVTIANNGNHQIPTGEKQNKYRKRIGNPLYVHKQIINCQAPYLNRGLVYDLLSILYWCSTIKNDDIEEQNK